MWISLDEMKTWMRGVSAPCETACQQASTSSKLARARPAMTGPFTSRAISETASRSPGEENGKPASMMSTFSFASWRAISSLSSMVKPTPADCSPSRSVVSKM